MGDGSEGGGGGAVGGSMSGADTEKSSQIAVPAAIQNHEAPPRRSRLVRDLTDEEIAQMAGGHFDASQAHLNALLDKNRFCAQSLGTR